MEKFDYVIAEKIVKMFKREDKKDKVEIYEEQGNSLDRGGEDKAGVDTEHSCDL